MRNDKRDFFYFSITIAFFLIAVSAFSSFQRNGIWATEYSLWKDSTSKSPLKPRPHENLGNYFREQNRYDEAILEYSIIVDLDSTYDAVYDGFFFMARTLDKSGDRYQAIICYSVICEYAPPKFQRAKDLACEGAYRLSR